MANKIAIITGATAGIGLATARKLAEAGYDLILFARRQQRLDEVKATLEAQFGIKIWAAILDVQSSKAVETALEALPVEWRKVDLLVNNAGLARGLHPFDQGVLQDWEEMIDTNLKGLLYITRIVAGWMRQQGQGHILNIGSTAAKEVYPNGNVYCATKHAVDALTKGLRMDLFGTGVRVGAIHPGMVETEFSIVRFRGDDERARKVYQGFRPLTADDVASTIVWVAKQPAHVNIADLVLTSTDQVSSTMVNRTN